MPPNKEDFQKALEEVFREAAKRGELFVDIRASDLHRRVGGYPGPNNRTPVCCSVMYKNMQPRDEIFYAPPKGKGPRLEIRYVLPRVQVNKAVTETSSQRANKPRRHYQEDYTPQNTLIIVSCTNDKIWDSGYSAPSYVPAGLAYTGRTFKTWKKARNDCPKLSNFSLVILSAKYGFIEPEHPVGNYDVTFSKPSTGPISQESLRRQVTSQKRNIGGKDKLNEFTHVVVLGSRDYIYVVEQVFNIKPLDFNEFFDKICPPNVKSTTGNASRPAIASRDHQRDIVQALLDYRGRQKTGGPFTRNKHADEFLRQNPFAFLMAASIDRGALAEAVWEIPFLLNKKLGHPDPQELSQMSVDQLEDMLRSLERKPRFPRQSARTITSLSQLVFGQFHGNAAEIWESRKPLDVVKTLEQIWGVGPGIAHMVVRILVDEFGYDPGTTGLRQIDVKADTHVVRVFYRTGLTPVRSGKACVEAARQLYPEFPGLLDWPAWEIGRTWCREHDPGCAACPLYRVCRGIGIELPLS